VTVSVSWKLSSCFRAGAHIRVLNVRCRSGAVGAPEILRAGAHIRVLNVRCRSGAVRSPEILRAGAHIRVLNVRCRSGAVGSPEILRAGAHIHIPTSHLLENHTNITHPSTPRSPLFYINNKLSNNTTCHTEISQMGKITQLFQK